MTDTVATETNEIQTAEQDRTETPLESLASICTVLAIGLFVMTFIFQNFEIPSASMVKTLLIGDHVLVDRISLAPPAKWGSPSPLADPVQPTWSPELPTPRWIQFHWCASQAKYAAT